MEALLSKKDSSKNKSMLKDITYVFYENTSEVLKYSKFDPEWCKTVASWCKRFGDLKNHYDARTCEVLSSDFVYPFPQDSRVSLVGDWGTGNKQSQMLANEIAMRKPNLFVHLGDVYYSGSEKEFKNHYLKPLMKAFRVEKPHELRDLVWTIPGNHDYYDGNGYFDCLQKIGSNYSSYFCLQNDKWSVIALDTALHDDNPVGTATGAKETYLPEEQLRWFKKRLDEAKDSNRGTIVLSHHMLFSSHETSGHSYCNESLMEQIGKKYLSKIDFWFWGHEHAWTRYAPYRGLKRGYLIGNGGMPVFKSDSPYKVCYIDAEGVVPPMSLSPPPKTYRTQLSNIELYCNGFYELNFSGDSLEVSYMELHHKSDECWVLENVEGETQKFQLDEKGFPMEISNDE